MANHKSIVAWCVWVRSWVLRSDWLLELVMWSMGLPSHDALVIRLTGTVPGNFQQGL